LCCDQLNFVGRADQGVKGNVLFLHGNDGPRSKGMWSLAMQAFADKEYNTLAFDQRGFSPDASPYNVDDYNYNYLTEDIFAIADTYFGKDSKFHVVAHDQGGRLGWHAIAMNTEKVPARTRFLSYTPLSEAHSDAFSDGLYGPNADPVQQTHFMYLYDFTLPGNDTLAYEGNIWNFICQKAGMSALNMVVRWCCGIWQFSHATIRKLW
jgi:pimeloyl-ACP methyl ester carboxylesterase